MMKAGNYTVLSSSFFKMDLISDNTDTTQTSSGSSATAPNSSVSTSWGTLSVDDLITKRSGLTNPDEYMLLSDAQEQGLFIRRQHIWVYWSREDKQRGQSINICNGCYLKVAYQDFPMLSASFDFSQKYRVAGKEEELAKVLGQQYHLRKQGDGWACLHSAIVASMLNSGDDHGDDFYCLWRQDSTTLAEPLGLRLECFHKTIDGLRNEAQKLHGLTEQQKKYIASYTGPVVH
jgi:hypothetical protein